MICLLTCDLGHWEATVPWLITGSKDTLEPLRRLTSSDRTILEEDTRRERDDLLTSPGRMSPVLLATGEGIRTESEGVGVDDVVLRTYQSSRNPHSKVAKLKESGVDDGRNTVSNWERNGSQKV
jgi:hypothetical protein